MPTRFIQTPHAPAPAGHYSQGVVHGDTVWVAGQLPFDPNAPDAPLGDVEQQVRQTFDNIAAILTAAGSGVDQLLQVNIFVTDPGLWAEVNRVYASILGDHRPARAIIPCGPLKRGAVLEVTAVAACGPASS
jgi:2-iminobutanoate/2-iminopropanoate deaminase